MLSLRWLGRVRPIGGIALDEPRARQSSPASGQAPCRPLEKLTPRALSHGLALGSRSRSNSRSPCLAVGSP